MREQPQEITLFFILEMSTITMQKKKRERPHLTQHLAQMINDPKSKDPRNDNLNGHKKWLSQ